MGDLRLLLLLPLCLAAFHGVTGCLECDPEFTEDMKSLLAKLVPSEVPGRTHLLERQIKEMIRLSLKVSHSDKMLQVLGAFILQGKLLDVCQNLESKLKEILRNFSEVACSEDCEEDSRKAES
ncbi:hypothetical protein MC885_016271 [Smutsia gigantea]|nr:hypothetical protein MC885_016271 [Smutsia gigantea]